jgi:hypothetical protein
MDAAVDICNDALSGVSQREIMSLDDETAEARLCRRHFRNTMREVLRVAQWRCARRRVMLSPLEEKPAFGWHEQFQLPADFVRLVSFNGERCDGVSGPLFEIEGRRLLANAGSARVIYVRDVTMDGEPGLKDMDALLYRTAAIALAAKLAGVFAPNSKLPEKFKQDLVFALRDARAANVFEAREPQIPAVDARSSDLLLSRVFPNGPGAGGF